MLCLCVIVQFGSSSYVCSKVRDRGVLKEMCCFFMCNGDVGSMRYDCAKENGRGVLRWMCYVHVIL